MSIHIHSRTTLHNGKQMPIIGLGVWQIQDGEEVQKAIIHGFKTGYRLIDTARIYGNEKGVGRAIKDGGLAREEVFVTTKLWNDDQGYQTTFDALDASLERLGVSYVDLYLIHWPDPDREVRKQTWTAMEELYASGKARAIGVSNYTISHLEEISQFTDLSPMVNQVEFHPFLYQQELLVYCREHGIVLEAYSPLARGKNLDDPRVALIAEKYQKTNAQVFIRWGLQHGCVVIPKSVHKERMEENIDVFDFELLPEDMQALNVLNSELR